MIKELGGTVHHDECTIIMRNDSESIEKFDYSI